MGRFGTVIATRPSCDAQAEPILNQRAPLIVESRLKRIRISCATVRPFCIAQRSRLIQLAAFLVRSSEREYCARRTWGLMLVSCAANTLSAGYDPDSLHLAIPSGE